MNERFKELAEQAWCNIITTKGMEYIEDGCIIVHPDSLEKFAELIVRECMACSTWVGKMNTNSVEPVHTAHAVNQRIKQQFGVEE